jgi:hypothetical protein
MVRKNTLRLATRLPKWSQLPRLLAACRDDDARIAGLALVALERWLSRYNVSFITPTTEQVQKAVKELEKTRRRVSPRILKELEALLRSFN